MENKNCVCVLHCVLCWLKTHKWYTITVNVHIYPNHFLYFNIWLFSVWVFANGDANANLSAGCWKSERTSESIPCLYLWVCMLPGFPALLQISQTLPARHFWCDEHTAHHTLFGCAGVSVSYTGYVMWDDGLLDLMMETKTGWFTVRNADFS